MRSTLVMIAVGVSAMFAAPSRAQDDAQPASRPMPTREGASMAMTLPGAVSDLDLMRYGEYLDLSPAQRLFLADAHKRYRAAVSSILKTRLPELDALNAEACRFLFRDGFTHAMVAATAAFHDKETAVEKQLTQADAVLFDELKTALSERQSEQMPRVINHRLRARCGALTLRPIFASRIDLAAWLEEVVDDREVLARLDPVLLEYEKQLTPMTVRLEEKIRSQEQSLLEMLLWEQRDEDDAFLPVKEQISRSTADWPRRLELLEEAAVLEHAIADLNAKTLPVLLEQLPPQRAAAMRERYSDAAFPVVYRVYNENALELCDRVLASPAHDKAQHDALLPLCETYRSSYQAACAEMERRSDQWQDHYARTRASMDKYEPYRVAMRALRDKRWEMTLALIGQIESIVPRDAAPAIADAARDLRQRIKNAIRDSRNDRYPGG